MLSNYDSKVQDFFTTNNKLYKLQQRKTGVNYIRNDQSIISMIGLFEQPETEQSQKCIQKGPCVLHHCHAGIPTHVLLLMPWLREGGPHPRFNATDHIHPHFDVVQLSNERGKAGLYSVFNFFWCSEIHLKLVMGTLSLTSLILASSCVNWDNIVLSLALKT